MTTGSGLQVAPRELRPANEGDVVIMGPARSRARRRYNVLARVYDQVTLEEFVYRRARRRAVELLGLSAGETVIDVGCGTGLSLGSLREAVGPTGAVVGIDLSEGMLDQASRRVVREGWPNVYLLHADASRLADIALPPSIPEPAAALFALSLSVMSDPLAALLSAAQTLPAGARIAVMDAGVPPAPAAGRVLAVLLKPVWQAVCTLAVADSRAHPWTHVDRITTGTIYETYHLGYVRVVAGTVPAQSGPH